MVEIGIWFFYKPALIITYSQLSKRRQAAESHYVESSLRFGQVDATANTANNNVIKIGLQTNWINIIRNRNFDLEIFLFT